MSHYIEQPVDMVFSVNGTEWHTMAHHIQKKSLEKSDVEPILFNLVTGKPSVLTEDGQTIVLDSYQTVLADFRNRADVEEDWIPLYVPKTSYRPIPNREIWDCMAAAIEDTDVTVATAGTLMRGKRFFMSLDLNGKELTGPRKEKFKAYLNATTSHDGVLMLDFRDSMTRIVCNNTFEASLMYGGSAVNVSIPHTKNALLQLNNFGDYLASILAARGSVMEGMKYLHNYTVSDDETNAVVAGYLSEEEAAELTTNAYNRTEQIRHLFRNGIGNKGQTRYDLFNGFTEFFTHHDGAGGKKATPGERMTVSRFGKAAQHKDAFFSLLMDEEKYNATKERGAKLYHDKHLAMMK